VVFDRCYLRRRKRRNRHFSGRKRSNLLSVAAVRRGQWGGWTARFRRGGEVRLQSNCIRAFAGVPPGEVAGPSPPSRAKRRYTFVKIAGSSEPTIAAASRRTAASPATESIDGRRQSVESCPDFCAVGSPSTDGPSPATLYRLRLCPLFRQRESNKGVEWDLPPIISLSVAQSPGGGQGGEDGYGKRCTTYARY
jgi:hypothetical protein